MTPAERYAAKLAQEWRRWSMDDKQRTQAIADLLRQVNAELQTAILSAANAQGTLTIQQMEQIRAQIDGSMGRFRAGYSAVMESQLTGAAQASLWAQNEAWAVYAPQIASPIPTSIVTDVVAQMRMREFNKLNLSDRIWRLDQGTRSLLERDILAQITEGSSAAKMAKRIEQYLLPGREVPRGEVPSAAYSNQPKSVSYNAYRLARTEINQTWHQVRNRVDEVLAEEDIVLGTRWVLSPQHTQRMLSATKGKRSRDICDDWAARMPGTAILKGQPAVSTAAEQRMLAKLQKYGIDPRGVYLPGKAPTDHPNVLCHTESVLIPREVLMERYGVRL